MYVHVHIDVCIKHTHIYIYIYTINCPTKQVRVASVEGDTPELHFGGAVFRLRLWVEAWSVNTHKLGYTMI